MTVTTGSKVSFEYTLKDDDGVQIDSSIGQDPLEYTHGAGQIVPGLERELEGMKIGENKEVTVAPKDGYGERTPDAFAKIPKENIPQDSQSVGSVLQMQDPQGNILQGVITEVRDDDLILDFNHPLAGKTLHFSVKIVGIEEAVKSDSGPR
ncbi:MAG: peptidylprolyl isomerase [Bdellovibrionales bacterium]|nr:peptidylprolyl isomerase [Bdellovibrionales bacterium]